MDINFDDKKATIEVLISKGLVGVFEVGNEKFYTFNPYYFEDSTNNDFLKKLFEDTKWACK